MNLRSGTICSPRMNPCLTFKCDNCKERFEPTTPPKIRCKCTHNLCTKCYGDPPTTAYFMYDDDDDTTEVQLKSEYCKACM